MWRSRLVGALCALAVAAPAQAQYGGTGGGVGGMGGMGGMGSGGRMGRSGQAPMMLVTDEQLEGPPTPGLMHQLLSLDDAQTASYSHSWDSLMAATQPQRDSARAAVKAMRADFQGGDRAGARSSGEVARRLAGELSRQDEIFDRSLKTLLTRDQRKEYDKWKDQNRKDAEARQREQMRGEGAGRGAGRMGGAPRF